MSLNYLNKQKKCCQVINGPTVQPIYNNYISVEPLIG